MRHWLELCWSAGWLVGVQALISSQGTEIQLSWTLIGALGWVVAGLVGRRLQDPSSGRGSRGYFLWICLWGGTLLLIVGLGRLFLVSIFDSELLTLLAEISLSGAILGWVSADASGLRVRGRFLAPPVWAALFGGGGYAMLISAYWLGTVFEATWAYDIAKSLSWLAIAYAVGRLCNGILWRLRPVG